MRTLDLNKTMPIDLVKILKKVDFQQEKEDLNEEFELYERKVARLKSLTRNYSVKYGYYYQSRLKSVMRNYNISYIQITNDRLKAFNKFNEHYSKLDVLRDFDNDFIHNLKELHSHMIEVNNKGKFRYTNTKIKNLYNEDIIVPIKSDKIEYYLKQIPLASEEKWYRRDMLINSWLIHCYFTGIQPFSSANGRTARFLLNKNINIYFDESIFLDKYIFEDLESYYQAVFDFCCNDNIEESIKWFIKIVRLALQKESEIIDIAVIKFYDLLEEFENMELIISRNAEMLAALFCIEGIYLQADIVEYFSDDIIDKRTINKLLNLLVEKKYLIKEEKLYITKGSIL